MTYFDKIENQKYLEDPFDFALNELLGAYLCTNIDNKFAELQKAIVANV